MWLFSALNVLTSGSWNEGRPHQKRKEGGSSETGAQGPCLSCKRDRRKPSLGAHFSRTVSPDSVRNVNGEPGLPLQPFLSEPISLGKALVPSASTQPCVSLARSGIWYQSAQDSSTGVTRVRGPGNWPRRRPKLASVSKWIRYQGCSQSTLTFLYTAFIAHVVTNRARF